LAKKVVGKIGLQIPAGKATPAPPIGPALGPYSLNIMDFCKQYNERTAPHLHVHHQDAAGVISDQAGAQDRVGEQGAKPEQGWHPDAEAARGNRQGEDARHQRERYRCG
jgi:hypothetical protein